MKSVPCVLYTKPLSKGESPFPSGPEQDEGAGASVSLCAGGLQAARHAVTADETL